MKLHCKPFIVPFIFSQLTSLDCDSLIPSHLVLKLIKIIRNATKECIHLVYENEMSCHTFRREFVGYSWTPENFIMLWEHISLNFIYIFNRITFSIEAYKFTIRCSNALYIPKYKLELLKHPFS